MSGACKGAAPSARLDFKMAPSGPRLLSCVCMCVLSLLAGHVHVSQAGRPFSLERNVWRVGVEHGLVGDGGPDIFLSPFPADKKPQTCYTDRPDTWFPGAGPKISEAPSDKRPWRLRTRAA